LELVVDRLRIEAGGPLVVVINRLDAANLGVFSSDRVFVRHGDRHAVCILNISEEGNPGVLGVYSEVARFLGVQEGDRVWVEPARRPESLDYIREKINGQRLTPWKIQRIVGDVVEHHLSDIELAAFVTALHIHGVSMEEVEALSRTMIWSGKQLDFGEPPILDKHSIGGVPGDKTTLLVAPIVASAGYLIPKSSSRAITSPAGTADRMEALAPVDIPLERVKEIVGEVGACIVWGGSIELAPADDLFIRVEYPLSIDPLLLPSIMSKKKAMGSTHLVVDIPVGSQAKIKTLVEAESLAGDFIELGKRLGLNIECAATEGSQPIGYNIGPILEAREALETLSGRGSQELLDKATGLAGILFEMVGHSEGRKMALDLVRSGKALEKMREIIEAQGGDSSVEPGDLVPGEFVHVVESACGGRVLGFNNRDLVKVSRAAGTPNAKGAGVVLHAKTGDSVEEGEPLFSIYAEKEDKLDNAVRLLETLTPVEVGERVGAQMVKRRIGRPTSVKWDFILDR